MKKETCPGCYGRGSGSHPINGPWKCSTCNGAGTIPAVKRPRTEARYVLEACRGKTFPNVPSVIDQYSRYVGEVVSIHEDGINVDYSDGSLWAFLTWSQVHNADEIKAAWEKLSV